MNPTRRGLLGGAAAVAAAMPAVAEAESVPKWKGAVLGRFVHERQSSICEQPAATLQPLPSITSPDHPDAALFAACAAAVAVWDRIQATPDEEAEEVWHAMSNEWADHLEVLATLRARTIAGCKAKARVLILEMDGNRPGEGDQERRLAWRLAHDVLLGAIA